MRAIQKYEYERIREVFDLTAKNLSHFSFIVRYQRSSYTPPGGTLVPEVNATWEEPGFYGFYTPGGVEIHKRQENGTGTDYTEFNATVKVPSKFQDGFKVLNPNAPAEAIGRRFDMRFTRENGNYLISGRPQLTGIILKDLFGQKPRLVSEAQFSIIDIPREQIDGITLSLRGAVSTGYTRFPNYDSGIQANIVTLVSRYGREAVFERFGL